MANNTFYATDAETERDVYVRWKIEAEEKFVDENEAREYIRLAQQGSDRAMESIIRKNMPLLANYARQYARRGSCFEDLQSEGMIAIMNAVRKFNLEGDCTVGTALITAIRTAMRRYVGEDRNVKIAINASENKAKLHAVFDRMKAEGEPITLELLAEAANMPLRMVKRLVSIDLGTVSMNIRAEGKEGEGDEFGDSIVSDTVTPYEEIEQNDQVVAMLKALKTLTEIEQIVIEFRYGLNGKEVKTYGELAALLNRSIEGIRQLEKKAVAKMRTAFEE
jgi:RNA polymerase sigma factor (sigma-70 family)